MSNCYSIPEKATNNSAGFDLYSTIDITIGSGNTCLIPIGIKLDLMPDYEAQIRSRSGLALKHQVTVLNSPGTIDPDYTGEICVILINHGKEDFKVTRGMRVAQIVFQKVLSCNLTEIFDIKTENNTRHSGGFGSTGY